MMTTTRLLDAKKLFYSDNLWSKLYLILSLQVNFYKLNRNSVIIYNLKLGYNLDTINLTNLLSLFD